MNKTQRSSFNMFDSVEKHFSNNPSAWNTHIPLAEAKETLSDLIASIREALSIQLVNNTGVAKDKKTLRDRLELQAYTVASGASAYATFFNLPELYLRVYYTKTHLKALRDAELQSVATNLANHIIPVLPALAPYGITPASIATLQETIQLFAADMSNPKEHIKTKKEATLRMAALIKTTSQLLSKQLDLLVVALEDTAPEFVQLYKTLRKVRKAGVRTLSLTTVVKDAATGTPIKGAVLLIEKSKIKRVSSTNGINRVKNVAQGRHVLLISHKDYLPTEVKFTVIKSQTTKLVIELTGLV